MKAIPALVFSSKHLKSGFIPPPVFPRCKCLSYQDCSLHAAEQAPLVQDGLRMLLAFCFLYLCQD